MQKILLFLAVYFLSVNATLAENMISSADEGVVRIINVISVNSYGTGTGFVISENHVVTNFHVIDKHVVLMVADGGVDEQHLKQAEVLWSSSEKDLAVLHVPQLSARKPLKLNEAEPEKGSQVYALGFPGAADIFDRNELNAVESSVTRGVLSRIMRNTTWPGKTGLLDIIQHSAQINGGNSGGPLINPCGEIIGVNTAGASNSQGIYAASYINVLIEALRTEGINFEATNNACSNVSANTIQPWVILLFLTLFILILLSFRRPRQQVFKTAENYTQWLRQGASQIKNYGQTTVKYEGKVLWALQGKHYHTEFYLPINQNQLQSTQGITLGRSEKLCDLVIKDDCISRRHARLTYDLATHSLLIEDLNSANGIKVNNKWLQVFHPIPIDIYSSIQLGEIPFKLVKIG